MAEKENRERTTQSTTEEQQSNQSRTEENKNNRRMERNEERTRKEDYLYYPILGYLTILYIRTPRSNRRMPLSIRKRILEKRMLFSLFS
jgi:hypothetical protein